MKINQEPKKNKTKNNDIKQSLAHIIQSIEAGSRLDQLFQHIAVLAAGKVKGSGLLFCVGGKKKRIRRRKKEDK